MLLYRQIWGKFHKKFSLSIFLLIYSVFFLRKLWAIGGYDGESNLSTVEVYDPETDSWTFVASMLFHGGGVGVRRFFPYPEKRLN